MTRTRYPKIKIHIDCGMDIAGAVRRSCTCESPLPERRGFRAFRYAYTRIILVEASRGITVAMTAAERETYHPERAQRNRATCAACPVAAIIAAFSVKLVLSVRTRVIPKLPFVRRQLPPNGGAH